MNSIEAVSASKVFDTNATDAVEVEIVTTNGYGRCSFPAPAEAKRRKHFLTDQATKWRKNRFRGGG